MDERTIRHERAVFAQQLRYLRKKAGITGTELARRTGMSQSKISRIETGHLLPSLVDVERIITAIKLPARDSSDVLKLARELDTTRVQSWRDRASSGLVDLQEQVANVEANATTIRTYQPLIVPGLLQTLEYARAVLRKANVTDQADVAAALARRIGRQEQLTGPDRTLTFVITEQALRLRVPSAEDLGLQLDRLRSLIEHDRYSLGIIPDEVEVPVIVNHGFVIYDETVVNVETLTDDISVTRPADVARYVQAYERLGEVAVRGSAARDLVLTAREGLAPKNLRPSSRTRTSARRA